MEYIKFKERITHVLAQFQPEITADNRMTPFRISDRLLALNNNPNPRLSGVMILVFNKNNEAHFSLIRRPEYDGHHSGQISFPGGKKEEEDIDLRETALRETHEEIGVREGIDVIGKISNVYIPPSKFLVTPYVGLLDYHPEFIKDDHEVAEVLEVPLAMLLDDTIVKQGVVTIGEGMKLKVPYFDIFDHMVWGATAIMLDEFKYLLK